MTAWRRIQRTQRQDVAVGVLIGFKLPNSVPVLMLDAKHFRIQQKPYTLYVAFHADKMRPLMWLLLPRYELREGYDRILRHMRREAVRVDGLVSDGHIGLRASVHDYYPAVVHQHCAFHVMAEVRRKIGGKRWLRTEAGKMFWEDIRKIALKSASLPEARCQLTSAKQKHPAHGRALGALERHLASMYEFTKSSTLANYRTSNRIENFMGVLEQRLQTFRSMKTPVTLIKIISSLIRIKYKNATNK